MTGHEHRPAVVFGAGNVGCGILAGQLAQVSPVVMVTRTPAAADQLQQGRVRVRHVGGPARPEAVVRPTDAIAIGDTAVVVDQIRHASVVVLAVGARGYAAVAPVLAAGLMTRRSPVNVLVCDNGDRAAARVRALVAEHGDDRVLAHGFVGALVDRIVTRDERADGVRILQAEARGRVYLDAHALRAPLAGTDRMRLVESFRAYLLRKLFVFSAGHAAAAYLGEVRGHRLLAEAMADEEVSTLVEAVMREGQAGLSACFGDRFAGGEAYVGQAVRRFAEPGLADTVERVGRDPWRKLAAHDRICGPARLATAGGAATPALSVVAAAALRSAAADPHLCGLPTRSIVATLARHAGLAPRHPFVARTLAASDLLTAGTSPAAVLSALSVPSEESSGPVRSLAGVEARRTVDR
ncbi:MAG: hypothetical protein WB441_05580 [Nocardioidaceae bacterium]